MFLKLEKMTKPRRSPTLKFLKRAVIGVLFYATATLAVPTVKKSEGDFKQYLDQNLERLIREQQEQLNIKYPHQLPKIHYSLPHENSELYGLYDPETDEIFLKSEKTDQQDWNFSTAQDTIQHELGHFYMDQLSETLGRGNWPQYREDMELEEILPIKLISEGVATYIERKTDQEGSSFADQNWPEDPLDFFVYPVLLYQGGFQLVSPIIDLYGQRGIQYLMFNPPSEEELFDLSLYQERIIEELAKEP